MSPGVGPFASGSSQVFAGELETLYCPCPSLLLGKAKNYSVKKFLLDSLYHIVLPRQKFFYPAKDTPRKSFLNLPVYGEESLFFTMEEYWLATNRRGRA
jgi:hypothetical protein